MGEAVDLGAAARSSYDASAERYVRRSDSSLSNAHYERPMIRSMLPPVAGLRVLDAGCAGGAHSEWLLEQGARVIAIDISPKMVELATELTGGRADIRVHDLREPMSFMGDGSIDVVLSSLSISYVQDLVPVFEEFHRILRATGVFVLSTHHPFSDWGWFELRSYYTVGPVQDHWEEDGVDHVFWRRTVEDIIEALHHSGFVVRRYLEPLPDRALKERFPDAPWTDEPVFLFLEAAIDDQRPPDAR